MPPDTNLVKLYLPAQTTMAHYETSNDMQRDADGSWVSLEDYQAIAAERDALQKIVDNMTAHIRVED